MIHPAPKPRRRKKVRGARRPAPRRPIRKRNAKRRAAEFRRCYGSKARVRFVKSLPCAACGVVGYSENAHVVDDGTKGAGRKSGYACIAPLCGKRPSSVVYDTMYEGCHSLHGRDNYRFTVRYPGYSDERAAAWTERRWQQYLVQQELRKQEGR